MREKKRITLENNIKEWKKSNFERNCKMLGKMIACGVRVKMALKGLSECKVENVLFGYHWLFCIDTMHAAQNSLEKSGFTILETEHTYWKGNFIAKKVDKVQYY